MTSEMAFSLEERELEKVCSKLGIPASIVGAYSKLNITHMYEWQVQCLYQTNVIQGSNLVYCAPTSGGKTMVAELVLLKSCIVSRKISLFVLPFISLIKEKEVHLSNMVRGYNKTVAKTDRVRVKGYYGERSSRMIKENIILCTIEKANIILNQLLELGQRKGDNHVMVGAVVIDEMHLCGDPSRGYLLELLVSKIKYLQCVRPQSAIQMVAMSATMKNVEQLALWFNAAFFRTDFRPVPLAEFIVAGGNISSPDTQQSYSLPKSEDVTSFLCKEGLAKGQQIIIFCPSKRDCELTCKGMEGFPHCSHRSDLDTTALKSLRLQLAERLFPNHCSLSPQASLQMSSIIKGFAFHHSDVEEGIRVGIEAAFKAGILTVIVATSTLATGVNLPAGRIIIKGLRIGRDLLSIVTYKQMCGRAGRAGQAVCGESFLVVNENELDKAIALSTSQMPPVASQINPSRDGGRGLLKAILELHSLKLCRCVEDVLTYVHQTLWYSTSATEDLCDVINAAKTCLLFLVKARILHADADSGDLQPTTNTEITRFGKAAMEGGLNPDEAMMYYEDFMLANEGLNLQTNLHILFLLTSIDHNIVPDFAAMWMQFERSFGAKFDSDRVFALVVTAVGIDPSTLFKWSHSPPSRDIVLKSSETARLLKLRASGAEIKARNSLSESEWRVLARCKRLWGAGLLEALIGGTPKHVLCAQCKIEETELDAVLGRTQMLAGKLVRFCGEIGWISLEKIANNFRKTLDATEVPDDLKQLMLVPGMTSNVARILSTAGWTSIQKFVDAAEDDVACQLQLGLAFDSAGLDSAKLVGDDDELKCHKHSRNHSGKVGQRIAGYLLRLKDAARKFLHEKVNEELDDALNLDSAITSADFPSPEGDNDSGDDTEDSSSVEGGEEEEEEGMRNFSVLSPPNRLPDYDVHDTPVKKIPKLLERSNKGLESKPGDLPQKKSVKNCLKNFHYYPVMSFPGNDENQVNYCQISPCQAANLKIRANLSPYLSPFTPSKRRNSGCYMYLLPENQVAPSSSLIEEVVKEAIREALEWKDLRLDLNAAEFLHELASSTHVSFEIVYRSAPIPSSRLYGVVAESWSSLISVAHEEHTTFVRNRVIKGMALCFGSNTAFYLPLPCPLPEPSYLSQSVNPSLENCFDGLNLALSPSAGGLSELPFHCMELISRFVGYSSILNRSLHLRRALSKYAAAEDGMGMSVCANGLMEVSKVWVKAARRGLLIEWSKRSCVEWQLVNELMTSKTITKVAVSMTSKLVILRERDIITEGPLIDPTVAVRLIPEPTDDVHQIIQPVKVHPPDELNYEERAACMRSIAVMRSTIAIEAKLRVLDLFHIYTSLEMPLLHTAADMQFTGMPVQWNFYAQLHAYLDSRQILIESMLRACIDSNFNTNSLKDVARLRRQISSSFLSYMSSPTRIQSCHEESNAWLTGQESDTSAIIEKHPLLRLTAESRSNASTISTIQNLTRHRVINSKHFGNRIRAVINTIGTETGRVIVTSPPLQQFPKECRYEAADFVTSEGSNRSVQHHIHTLMQGGLTLREAVVQLNGEYRSNGRVQVQRRQQLDKELLPFISGVLKVVTTKTINAPAPPLGQPLADYWISAGHDYSDNDVSQIVQVLVELAGSTIYHYPADKVFPLSFRQDVVDSSLVKRCSSSEIWDDILEDKCGGYGLNIPLISPRSGFRASPGYAILSADYSQIELRIMAHYSSDFNLISAFRAGQDVFRMIASQWLKKADESVTTADRNSIKQLCYAFIYGAGPSFIAEKLQCTYEEAKRMMERFINMYPGLKTFMSRVKTSCRSLGYVETLLGRRRHIPNIRSAVREERARAERQAVNTTCQGSAADLIKLAMLNIHQSFTDMAERGLVRFRRKRSAPGAALYNHFDDDVRLILQIHDELLFEVRLDALERVAIVVKNCMENAIELRVPLQIKLNAGPSWGELSPLVLASKDVSQDLFESNEGLR